MPERESEKELANAGSDENYLNRRQFFVKLGGSSLAVAGAGACVFAAQYLSPNVLYEPSPIVSVGTPDHFAADSVTLDATLGIFVVRQAEGFFAMSAICTHLGCLSAWKADAGVIACPCHGSTFQRDGRVIAGPAPRPLPWLKMWMGDDGNLMVDRSATVAARKEYIRT